MKCPHCGLINPDSSQRCDCGYDFTLKDVPETEVTTEEQLARALKEKRDKIIINDATISANYIKSEKRLKIITIFALISTIAIIIIIIITYKLYYPYIIEIPQEAGETMATSKEERSGKVLNIDNIIINALTIIILGSIVFYALKKDYEVDLLIPGKIKLTLKKIKKR